MVIKPDQIRDSLWNRLSEEKRRIVARQIGSTRRNLALAALFRLETMIGRFLPLPCGIRVIAVLRKP